MSLELIHKEKYLFFFMVVITITPVWLVNYFPSQDGPIHLWILHIIGNYSGSDSQLLREYFTFNSALEPNIGFYIIAYPFSIIFGTVVAEKIYLTLLAFLFCYGARYAIINTNPSAVALSYLTIPLVFGFFTHMGFYNFMLGVALFLPVLVYSVDKYHKESYLGYWKIAIVGFILVLVHLVPFVAYLFVFGLYVVSFRILEVFKNRRDVLHIRKLFVDSCVLTVVVLPGVLVAAYFVFRHGITDNPVSSTWPLQYYSYLFHLNFLKSFTGAEEVIVVWPYRLAMILTFGLVGWYVFRNKEISSRAVVLTTVLIGFLFLYLHAPISSKNIPLNPRLAPLVILLAVIAISAYSGRSRLLSVMFLSCLMIMGGSIYRFVQYGYYNYEISQIKSLAEHMDKNSTFLPIRLVDELKPFDNDYSFFERANPLLHAGAYIAIERQSIYLRSTLMSPTYFPYFPFVFKSDRDPFVFLGKDIERIGSKVHFNRFRETSGERISYIIISTEADSGADEGCSYPRYICEELEDYYQWLFTSENGKYNLYRNVSTI